MVKKRPKLHGNSARNFTSMLETNTSYLGKGCTLFRWMCNRIQQYKPWIIDYYIYHMWSGMTKRCKMRPKTLIYSHIYPFFISKIGFLLMPSQDHDLFRNVYFHYIISNTIFKWNVRGPKIGPFLESILHLFVMPLHI